MSTYSGYYWNSCLPASLKALLSPGMPVMWISKLEPAGAGSFLRLAISYHL